MNSIGTCDFNLIEIYFIFNYSYKYQIEYICLIVICKSQILCWLKNALLLIH
jgi:uncharacterized membrane protein (GlpM family)